MQFTKTDKLLIWSWIIVVALFIVTFSVTG
jgi:hypothetical protein